MGNLKKLRKLHLRKILGSQFQAPLGWRPFPLVPCVSTYLASLRTHLFLARPVLAAEGTFILLDAVETAVAFTAIVRSHSRRLLRSLLYVLVRYPFERAEHAHNACDACELLWRRCSWLPTFAIRRRVSDMIYDRFRKQNLRSPFFLLHTLSPRRSYLTVVP